MRSAKTAAKDAEKGQSGPKTAPKAKKGRKHRHSAASGAIAGILPGAGTIKSDPGDGAEIVSLSEMTYCKVGDKFVPAGSYLEHMDGNGGLFREGDWLHVVVNDSDKHGRGHRHCIRRLNPESAAMLEVMRWLPRLTDSITRAIQEQREMPIESGGWKKMPPRERRAWAAYRKALGLRNDGSLRMTGKSLQDAVEEGVLDALKRFVLENMNRKLPGPTGNTGPTGITG